MDYAHQVSADISPESWDELYFALLSLKSHIQSLPGWLRMDITAREMESIVDLRVETRWEGLDELKAWLEQGVTPDALIRSIAPDAETLSVSLAAEV